MSILNIEPEELEVVPENIEQLLLVVSQKLGDLSSSQKAWCTPSRMAVYLDGRNGDVHAASELVCKALRWREEHQELLSLARPTKWQEGFAARPSVWELES